MKKYAATLFLFVLLAGLGPAPVAAQDQSQVEFAPYAVILATRGPGFQGLSADEAGAVRTEAIDNLREALKMDEFIIAGLVTDGSAEFIMIVETSDESKIREIIANAKNVKNGMFQIKAYSWYAPAGLKLETKRLVR